jgi:hypothetical protein
MYAANANIKKQPVIQQLYSSCTKQHATPSLQLVLLLFRTFAIIGRLLLLLLLLLLFLSQLRNVCLGRSVQPQLTKRIK